MFEKEGYEPLTVKIERYRSGWVWWNLWCFFWVYPCIQQDRYEGGYWRFDDDIYVTLTKRGGTVESTAPTPQLRHRWRLNRLLSKLAGC